MQIGQVKAFSAEKGYGFIVNEQGSYFFHASQLPTDIAKTAVKPGDVFEFDDVPTPKGPSARKLKKVEQITSLVICYDRIIKNNTYPNNGETVFALKVQSPFFKSPQDCRNALIDGAHTVGCNAVLDLVVHRETKREYNGYQHVMHWAEGYLCLVAQPKPCESDQIEDFENRLELQIAVTRRSALELAEKFNSQRNPKKFPIVRAFILIVIFAVVAKFDLY